MTIKFDILEDGTYLTVKNTSLKASELEALIEAAIAEKGLRNVNKRAIAKLVMGKGERREKITENNAYTNIDEEARLSVSENAMEAYISFKAPLNGGYLLTGEEIYSFITNMGIIYGLDETLLGEISKRREYGKKYLIAQGIKTVNGRDGRLEFLFDNTDERFKPVILENGSVDYYNIKNVEMAAAGQALVRIHEAENGINGVNIYGKILKARQGKPPIKIILGKNVTTANGSIEIVATAGGQITYSGRCIGVSTVMEIKGDVGVKSGNIKFNGSVIVYGDLKSDFSITAEGNVEVRGICEGNIIADGNVTIIGGIYGVNRSKVVAGGHIGAKFISSCKIIAGGNVHTGDILNSVIKVKGSAELHGRKGALVGSKLYAKQGFKANIVGASSGSAVTEVYVGIDYELFEEYAARLEEYRLMKKEYIEIVKSVAYLDRLASDGRLSIDKKKHRTILKYDEKVRLRKLKGFKSEVTAALIKLNRDSGESFVRARAVHQRVRLQIGNAIILVKDTVYNSRFRNDNGVIKIEPFVKS